MLANLQSRNKPFFQIFLCSQNKEQSKMKLGQFWRDHRESCNVSISKKYTMSKKIAEKNDSQQIFLYENISFPQNLREIGKFSSSQYFIYNLFAQLQQTSDFIISTYLMTNKSERMQALLLNNPALKDAQKRLHSHPIYHSLSTVDDLRLFMERHCWAVWDFFQLIKDLQRDLTNTKRFWTPCVDVQAARFINEIVIGEQTDETNVPNEYLSHFELYLRGMEEVGADTKAVREFVKNVSQLEDNQNTYADIEKLINSNGAVDYVKKFNLNTCAAIFLSIPYTAGQFFFGREDPIPEMFTKLVKTVEDNKLDCKTLKYYLNRHIELDGSFHGPKTSHLLLCLSQKHDPDFKDILEGALNAIEHRILLWDGILAEINQRKSSS